MPVAISRCPHQARAEQPRTDRPEFTAPSEVRGPPTARSARQGCGLTAERPVSSAFPPAAQTLSPSGPLAAAPAQSRSGQRRATSRPRRDSPSQDTFSGRRGAEKKPQMQTFHEVRLICSDKVCFAGLAHRCMPQFKELSNKQDCFLSLQSTERLRGQEGLH